VVTIRTIPKNLLFLWRKIGARAAHHAGTHSDREPLRLYLGENSGKRVFPGDLSV